MRRRDLIRAGVAAGAGGLAGCAGDGDDPSFTEGFEDGIGDWEADATRYIDDLSVRVEPR